MQIVRYQSFARITFSYNSRGFSSFFRTIGVARSASPLGGRRVPSRLCAMGGGVHVMFTCVRTERPCTVHADVLFNYLNPRPRPYVGDSGAGIKRSRVPNNIPCSFIFLLLPPPFLFYRIYAAVGDRLGKQVAPEAAINAFCPRAHT